jgi:predicted phosphodiesterase
MRTLIIGDVHGCLEELLELLALAAIGNDDRVVFVGDLVGRGPDTPGVLNLVRRINAVSVQGNHERKLLQARESELLGTEKMKLGSIQRELMQSLNPDDWAHIKAMPLYLLLEQHQVCVVHAGVVPGVPISEQDPWVLTHIRSLEMSGQPSPQLGTRCWAAHYAGPPHIVFGHSAQVGLQMHEHATGLDSGCVYGGRLTGLCLEEGQPVPAMSQRQHALLSVAARKIHYKPRA